MKKIKKSNKEIVTEIAASMFIEQGYTYTSMDEVVEKSGVSKSNVYYHFSGKDELLEAVIDYWVDTYTKNIETIAQISELTVKEKFTIFLEGLSDSVENRNYQGSCPFISFVVQTPKGDEHIAKKINLFFDYLTTACSKLIKEGIDNNEFRDSLDPEEIAKIFINNLEGALFLSEVRKDKSNILESATDLFKLLD